MKRKTITFASDPTNHPEADEGKKYNRLGLNFT